MERLHMRAPKRLTILPVRLQARATTQRSAD